VAHTDKALSIRYHGTVVCLGAGRGIHTIVPLARDPKTAGNRVVSILGANAEPDLVREEAIRLVSDEVIVSALGKGLGGYLRSTITSVRIRVYRTRLQRTCISRAFPAR